MEEVITIANSYYERANYTQALKLLETLQLNLHNVEHQEAFILLSKIYCNDIDDLKGIQTIRDLLRHYPNDNHVIDVALEIFSNYSNLANDAKKLAKEMITLYPDNDYYYYVLSYVEFHWLKGGKEQVLDHLNKALTLSNHSNYLDFGHEVYSTYGSEKEKNNCLELMIQNDPLSYETRKCLLNNFIENKEYSRFLESALDLAKEYPDNAWLIDKINDVKNILYGDFLDLLVLRSCEKLISIQKYFDNPLTSFITLNILPILIFLCCIILAPFFLVTILIANDYKHFRLYQNDELYRKLIVINESFKSFETSALFSLTLNSNKHTKLYLTPSEIVVAKSIKGNIHYLQEDEVNLALIETNIFRISDVDEIILSNLNLEINLRNGHYETFDISSPEIILAIEAWLKKFNWLQSANFLQNYLKIILNGSILIISGVYIQNLGILKNWNIYLITYTSLALIVNGLYYLWFRFNNRLTYKYYIPNKAMPIT